MLLFLYRLHVDYLELICSYWSCNTEECSRCLLKTCSSFKANGFIYLWHVHVKIALCLGLLLNLGYFSVQSDPFESSDRFRSFALLNSGQDSLARKRILCGAVEVSHAGSHDPDVVTDLLSRKILGRESFTRWFVGESARTSTQSCLHPHHLWVRFFLKTASRGWVSLPLKLDSFPSKIIICRSLPPPKILEQKSKSNHLGDSNELPIN